MSHHQFESELAHLELIVPLLIAEPPLGLPYWRRRILALSPAQGQPPGSSKRLGRLLKLFEEIELAASLVRRAAVVPSRTPKAVQPDSTPWPRPAQRLR